MSTGSDEVWWGTNGINFIVRDLTMRGNKIRQSPYFYFDTKDWSVFEDSFQNVRDKRKYKFLPKYLAENEGELTELFLEKMERVKDDFLARWDELDNKILEFVHLRHLHRHDIEISSPTFVPASPGAKHRVTHCWSCKKGLDNFIDVTCTKCRWMLCGCGACGCGYYR